MISTLRTQDGVHFLTAELDGTVNATRTEEQLGAWQEWDVLPDPDGDPAVRVLKSAHGTYLSAYSPDHCVAAGVPPCTVAATADSAGPWERWRAANDGDVTRLQSCAWGLWLSPQNVEPNPQAGGGAVLCNGPDPASWETLFASDQAAFGGGPSWPAGVTPGDMLPRLRVGDDRRWLVHPDGSRFDYRDKSAFTLLGRLMDGQTDVVNEYLAWARSRRFTVLRVFICNTIGGYPSGPDEPGFWEACDQLVHMFAAHGIYMRACLIAATEPFGGVWEGHGVDIWNGSVKSQGEQFCVDFATRYRDNGTIIGELFNEPNNIGLAESQAAVVELAHRVKAAAPELLLMGGHYDDETQCVEPFDLVTIHFARHMEVRGSAWIKRSSEYPPCQQHSQAVAMPCVSGEPANAGQDRQDQRTGDVYKDASVSFAAAAMSRAHQYLPCFHSDDGLVHRLARSPDRRAHRRVSCGARRLPDELRRHLDRASRVERGRLLERRVAAHGQHRRSGATHPGRQRPVAGVRRGRHVGVLHGAQGLGLGQRRGRWRVSGAGGDECPRGFPSRGVPPAMTQDVPPPVPVVVTLSAAALEELKAAPPPAPPLPRVDLTIPTVAYVAAISGAWAGASATCVADDVCDTVTPVLPTVGSVKKALGWGLLIQGGTLWVAHRWIAPRWPRVAQGVLYAVGALHIGKAADHVLTSRRVSRAATQTAGGVP